MKTKQLDQSQTVQFELQTAELPKFVVTGSYEDVAPIYTDLEHNLGRLVTPKPKRVAVVEAPVTPVPAYLTGSLFGRIAIDAEMKIFDIINDTNTLEEANEARRARKVLAFKEKIGLMAVPVCAKHRKALATVKNQ